MPPPRPTVALLVLPLAAALLTACGGDDATTASPSTLATEVTEAPAPTSTGSASASPSASPAPPSPTAEVFDGKEIAVTYAGGRITPAPGSQEVAVGTRVRLTVTSDVPEEVHVHTYDLTAQIAPGTPGVLEFVASIPGQHEVELEGSHKALFELVVR